MCINTGSAIAQTKRISKATINLHAYDASYWNFKAYHCLWPSIGRLIQTYFKMCLLWLLFCYLVRSFVSFMLAKHLFQRFYRSLEILNEILCNCMNWSDKRNAHRTHTLLHDATKTFAWIHSREMIWYDMIWIGLSQHATKHSKCVRCRMCGVYHNHTGSHKNTQRHTSFIRTIAIRFIIFPAYFCTVKSNQVESIEQLRWHHAHIFESQRAKYLFISFSIYWFCCNAFFYVCCGMFFYI